MILTRDNYHSLEANQRYMSWHQFKDFMTCEAGALSHLKFREPIKSNALILGTLLHAWNEGEEAFKKSLEENSIYMYQKNGKLYKDFEPLYAMIDTLESSDLCMEALAGEKEVIMTGFIGGVEWKICIDSFNRKYYRFSDLKSAAKLKQKGFNSFSGRMEGFVTAYGYLGQVSAYGEIVRQNLNQNYLPEPYLVIVTKEDPPDKVVASFDIDSINQQLEWIEENIPRVQAVKEGRMPPTSCGKCSYCRLMKTLTGKIHYSDL